MLKITGLDEFQKKLDTLSNNAMNLDGNHNVPVTELLTPSFVSKHTNFKSVEELFEKSGFKVESPEDFEAISDTEWDNYIQSTSNFDNWNSMLSKATEEWVAKKLE